MRVNPFYDSWLFLIGETGSHLGISAWRYLVVLWFLVANYRERLHRVPELAGLSRTAYS